MFRILDLGGKEKPRISYKFRIAVSISSIEPKGF